MAAGRENREPIAIRKAGVVGMAKLISFGQWVNREAETIYGTDNHHRWRLDRRLTGYVQTGKKKKEKKKKIRIKE